MTAEESRRILRAHQRAVVAVARRERAIDRWARASNAVDDFGPRAASAAAALEQHDIADAASDTFYAAVWGVA